MRLLCAAWLLAAAAPAQDFSRVQIEKFVSGFNYAEGPAWSREGELIFSDVPADLLYSVKSGHKPVVLRSASGGAMGNAFDSQGRLYTCETRGRRVVRTDKNGQIEVLADRWQGKRLNAPNDIAVRRDGHVWFTDPAFASEQDTRELDFYGVYHIEPSGKLEVVAKPRGRPNGVALSPDGKTLYVTNSDERNVRQYRLGRKGEASQETVLIPYIDGVPDGIRTDSSGNLYVAARNLFIFSSKGQLLGMVPFDDAPSNCAFGDADLLSLYVTARTAIYRLRVPVKGWTVDSKP